MMTTNKGRLVATFLTLVALGFAAMSTNPPFVIPSWVPIAFFIAAVATLLWLIILLVRGRNTLTTTTTTKGYDAVIPILQKMDERIRNIAKREANKAIDFQMYEKVNNVINKDIFKVKTSKPKTIKGLKKSVNKLETEIGKTLKEELTSIRSGVEILEPVSVFLDSKGFGLKQQRENDKHYARLALRLQHYRNLPYGTEIDDIIRFHITCSEVSANMLLATIRAMQVKVKGTNVGFADVISTQMQIAVEQAEKNMREATQKIRTRIGECIRELKYEKSENIQEKDNRPRIEGVAQSRRDALESSRVAWGLWHTGTRMRIERLLKLDSLKRILILEPNTNSKSVKVIAERSGETEKGIITQLEDTTREALKNGKDIRWYSEHRESAFTIYDNSPIKEPDGSLKPCSDNAWIYVEYLTPTVGVDQRTGEAIHNKGKDKDRFMGFYQEYEDIWNNKSIPANPPPSSHKEGPQIQK